LKGLYKDKDLAPAKLSSVKQKTYFLVRLIALVESISDSKVGIAPGQIIRGDVPAATKLLQLLRDLLDGDSPNKASKKQLSAGIKAAKNFSKQQRKRAKDALGSMVKFQAICRGYVLRSARCFIARTRHHCCCCTA